MLRELLCFFGFHVRDYKFEHSLLTEHGHSKKIVSLVRVCTHCPNGRKIIVNRSLLLGE